MLLIFLCTRGQHPVATGFGIFVFKIISLGFLSIAMLYIPFLKAVLSYISSYCCPKCLDENKDVIWAGRDRERWNKATVKNRQKKSVTN